MSALEELQEAVQRVAAEAGDAVVGVGRGSGLVVGPDRVLTTAHSLRGDEATVSFAGGGTATGTLAGLDVDAGLAVLAVDGAPSTLNWPDAPLDSRLGEAVFAVSRPRGGALRVTFGLVSSVGRSFRGPRGRRVGGTLEHTARLGRGSSGGPLLDAGGRLLGVNARRMGDGFSLAIPADADLRRRVDALGRGEAPPRLRLGVTVAPGYVARRLRRAVGLEDRDGLLVRAVEEGSAADRAGIQPGDLIVAAEGRPVSGIDSLFEALDRQQAGAVLTVGVVRGADERDVPISLEASGAEATR